MESLAIVGEAARTCQVVECGFNVLKRAKGMRKRGFNAKDLDRDIGHLRDVIATLVIEGPCECPDDLGVPVLASHCATLFGNLVSKVEALKSKKPKSIWKGLKIPTKTNDDTDELRKFEANYCQCHTQLQELLLGTVRSQVDETLDRVLASGRIAPGEVAVLQSTIDAVRPVLGSSHTSKPVLDTLRSLVRRLEESIARAQQVAILKLLDFQAIHERFESITQAQGSTFSWLLDTGRDGNQKDTGNSAVHLDEALVQARQSFVHWLENGDGFFYVSGKPGAGKSTLMKFVYRSESFYHHINAWSRGAALLVGRFFFWKPGKPEQKSLSGLLRGLLYSVLEATPAVTAIAFPELCESFNRDRLGSPAIEHEDVQRAFDNILRSSTASECYKMVLIVDGLDEFEGDHARLIDLMESWVTKYRLTIKICLSSREYSIFERFFSDCPKLRLHELTRNDMSRLITSRLAPNKIFASLSADDAARIEALISERAEGVFLWVVVVVAAIEDGMVNGAITNATELEMSVQLCPNDLDDLFLHLLKSITVHYREWAFRAISVVLFAQFKVPELLRSTKTYAGVGLLDLMLLDESSRSWDMSTFQPRSEHNKTDILTRLEAARNKVIGRCKGFLSVVTLSGATSWPANGDERMYAALTHRSVVEFLASDAAEGLMATYLSGFDPFFALFSTVLACLRFLQPSDYPLLKSNESLPWQESLELADVLEGSLKERLEDLVQCAFLRGQSGSPKLLSLLDSIGDAIKRNLTVQLAIRHIRLPAAGSSPHDLLTTITLSNGIYGYSEWRRRHAPRSANTAQTNASLSSAFRTVLRSLQSGDHGSTASEKNVWIPSRGPLRRIRWGWCDEGPAIAVDRFSNLLAEFFERGVDTNWKPLDGLDHSDWSQTLDQTPWTCWQTFLWAMLASELPYTDRYADFIDRFLRHGADPDIEIFSMSPLEPLWIERATPQDDWVLLVPFARDKGLLGTYLESGTMDDSKSRPAYDRMPCALVRPSATICTLAGKTDWNFTLSDLLASWFPQHVDHFTGLLDSLSRNKTVEKGSGPTAFSGALGIDAELLGSPRGVCDLGTLLREVRGGAARKDGTTTPGGQRAVV